MYLLRIRNTLTKTYRRKNMGNASQQYVSQEVSRALTYALIANLVTIIVVFVILVLFWWNTKNELEKKN
jgi:hypothetical protein